MTPTASPRWFVPQRRDQGLAATAAHRTELAGSPRDLAWPGLCASCGAAAAERIPVTKVFVRYFGRRQRRFGVDDVRSLVKCTIAVPFCGTCAARHRDLEPRIGTFARLWSYVTSVFVIPLAIALFAVALYFVPSLVGDGAAIISMPKAPLQAAVFAAAAAGFAVLIWHQTRHKRVPRQTEVTLSFDFSDNMGNVLTGEHRIYAMSNAAFAESFRFANAGRLWTEERRARGRRRENIAAAIVAALTVLAAGAYWLTR